MIRGLTAAAAALAIALAASARPAVADVTVEARFGHGGGWVVDAATPFDLVLRNDAQAQVQVRIEVRLAGFGEDDAVVVERDVVLGPGATRREGFVLPGPSSWQPKVSATIATTPTVPIHTATKSGDRGELGFEVVGAGRSGLSVRTESSRAVGVMLDPQSVVATRVSQLTFGRSGRRVAFRSNEPVSVLAVDPDVLRLAPLALGGLDTLIVCDPDATFCADPAHLDGLLDWAALGGRLIVSVGENASSFAASPLAQHLPAAWGGTRRQDYSALARAFSTSGVLPTQRREGPRVDLEPHAGTRVRMEGLVVESRFGDGSIAVAGVDLRLLLEAASPDPDAFRPIAEPFVFSADHVDPWETSANSWNASFDVASRLGRTLQQAAFRPPPLPLVLFALIIYVLVVGPVDWFVLRRLRKERYTTFTFGAAVLVFTVLAYIVSVFLFSADAVVNRVTFVRFASSGRPGRELVRVHDLVGFFAPTGGMREMSFPLPGAVLGSNLPGLQASGRVGAALPVVVRGNDPLAPKAELEVAFRSQRVVHTELCGTAGRTITAAPSGDDGVEVTNALPVDLTECWVFFPDGEVVHVGKVPSGSAVIGSGRSATSGLGWEHETAALDDYRDELADHAAGETRRFLAHLVASALTATEPPAGQRALRRAGIVCELPRVGRALVVAVAERPPIALPGWDGRGRQHVVLTKEIDLP